MRRLATAAILFALSMAIAGCGGGSMSSSPSPTPPKPISVSISPSSINIATSQSRSFNATVSNDASGKGVTWSLTGTGCSDVECGVLSAVKSTSVIYTAPDTLTVPAGCGINSNGQCGCEPDCDRQCWFVRRRNDLNHDLTIIAQRGPGRNH